MKDTLSNLLYILAAICALIIDFKGVGMLMLVIATIIFVYSLVRYYLQNGYSSKIESQDTQKKLPQIKVPGLPRTEVKKKVVSSTSSYSNYATMPIERLDEEFLYLQVMTDDGEKQNRLTSRYWACYYEIRSRKNNIY